MDRDEPDFDTDDLWDKVDDAYDRMKDEKLQDEDYLRTLVNE